MALLMAGVWGVMKIVAKRLQPEGIVEEKIFVHYIKTGEVGGAPTRPASNTVGCVISYRPKTYCVVWKATRERGK